MSRKALIFTILAVLVLGGLAWILIVMPYRAQRQWDAAKAALVARGEKMSLADYPPPLIRDEDNFFADPIWWELTGREVKNADSGTTRVPKLAEEERQFAVFKSKLEPNERAALKADFPEFESLLGGSRHEVMSKAWKQAAGSPEQPRRAAELILRVQAPAEPIFTRLRELSKRPDGWFPLDYNRGLAIQYDHIRILLSVGQWLGIRVRASLETGDYQAAYQDAVLIYRLKEALRRDALVLPALVGASLEALFSDAIDRGIRVHAWTAEELRDIDRMLATIDVPRRLAAALRMERALMLDVAWPSLVSNAGTEKDPALSFASKGGAQFRWVYRKFWMSGDQALYTDIVQREVESLEAVPRQGMNPKFFPDHIENYLRTHSSEHHETSKLMTMATLPAQSKAVPRAAKVQTDVFLTRAAIALELYRMEHGAYPESLAVLKPGKPGGIPLDLITGEPFRYRRNDDGSFAMWSVGWNEKDEDGLISEKTTDGDWVWGE